MFNVETLVWYSRKSNNKEEYQKNMCKYTHTSRDRVSLCNVNNEGITG